MNEAEKIALANLSNAEKVHVLAASLRNAAEELAACASVLHDDDAKALAHRWSQRAKETAEAATAL